MAHAYLTLAYKLPLVLVPKNAGLSHPVAGWVPVTVTGQPPTPPQASDSREAGELGGEGGRQFPAPLSFLGPWGL